MNSTNQTLLAENDVSQREYHKRAWRVCLVILLSLVLVYLFWISLNFYTYHRLYTDSGVFAAVSNHVLHGKVLYKDVWDHKPPAIYIINAIPLVGGDGSVLSIRFYERFFAILGALAFFAAVFAAFKNPLLAFFASLLFNIHFYNPVVFQGGNLTEEYGAAFILIGICGLLVSKYVRHKELTIASLIGSGFFFSFAVFTKETFFLSIIPWFVFLLFLKTSKEMTLWSKVSFFFSGVGIPILIFLTASIWAGNLEGWMDVFSFNVQYAKHSRELLPWRESLVIAFQRTSEYVLNQTWTVRIAALIGAASCFYTPFVRKYSYFPWACLAALFFDCIAASIGGYDIGHYYLQAIPSYVFMAATGCAFLFYLIPSFRFKNFVYWIVLLLAFMVLDTDPLKLYKERLTVRLWHPQNGMISNAILERKRESDALWAGRGENANFYQETGLLSPTKFIYVYDHLFLDTLFSTGEEKKALLTDELMKNPPTFMILSQEDFERFRDLGLIELMDWIDKNYSPVPGLRESNNELYTLNPDR